MKNTFRRFAVPLAVPLTAFLLCLPFASRCRANWDEDSKVADEFTKSFREQTALDPAKALAQGRAFIKAHPAIDASFLAGAYNSLARMQMDILKDNKGAVATADEALALPALQNSPTRFLLLGTKVEVLLADKKAMEAEALLKAQWPQIVAPEARWQLGFTLPRYVSALQAQGKSDEATLLLHQTFEAHLPYLGTSGGMVQENLIEALLKDGDEALGQEALGRAKLSFMLCRFDEGEIANATKLLMRVWSSVDLSPATGQAFLKSQQDGASPNPLKDIKLPVIDVKATKAHLATFETSQVNERVTLRLLSNDYRGAMLEARRAIVDKPESSDGVLEACRVFKAADLNVVRANAFIEFMKGAQGATPQGTTAQGANPMTDFLREYPAAGQKADATNKADAAKTDAVK